ncbi:HWE histidine kinase domain-containing protein [Rhizorhabdus dicambivorans]|uniref:histidine kinase n=1 Tax=Rhizorhabdus dicambivorans TaxID=1850238 RepID=A0A2A4G378_9SPHN|nr:HWE histidine kinase domain-containing protein [Rhizorhabdus dicambivorans]ATE64987.1 two-component system sensor histidine kinase/response regulator [Rhizorhabdus dicambivorans]PCE44260.1 two-component system sensor histidine kinase/response regulator [Rhizorhabdus dicambivorans]
MTEFVDQPDLTACDREPIHLLGAIQSFGFLLAVSADWLVSRASENLVDHIGVACDAALGQPLDKVLSEDAVHDIRNRIAYLQGEDSVERLLRVRLKPDLPEYDVAIHFSHSMIIIEGEPSGPAGHEDIGITVRSMLMRQSQATSMQNFRLNAVRQIRAITGFDRVMLYRFDQDGAGEVVAESVVSKRESFLGLRYPATDIPKQARALYVRNVLRLIADLDDPGSPVLPEMDVNGQPLDLSMSVLRSVSRVHIEYLSNMGVRASLSISVVCEGRLWGLIACHHYSPLRPTLEQRTAAELFGRMFSMMLESREREETAAYEQRSRAITDRLMAVVAQDADLLHNPEWIGETISAAVPNDGVGVYLDGKVSLSGMAPDEAQFRALVRDLSSGAASQIVITDCIARIHAPAAAYAERAAGMLAVPISRKPRDYVVLFRGEKIRSVRWAGDPQKAMEEDANGVRLSPRKSFDAWRQLVQGVSEPFTSAEQRVAEAVRTSLLEVVLLLAESRESDQARAHERQDLLIAELNHRVRNVLSLVRSLIARTRGSAQSYEEFAQTLEGRVQSLARAHDQLTVKRWGPAEIEPLVRAEANAYLGDNGDRIRLSGPKVALDPVAFNTVSLVLHELITNCAKYGALSDSGHVDLRWGVDVDGSLLITWRETGGPPVRAPERKGFGTTIIERSIPYDLGGRAHTSYRLTGFEADFTIPARFVTVGEGTVSGSGDAEGGTASQVLEDFPRNVLLVEDSMLIALDVEDALKALGATRVVTASSVRQARDALGEGPFDFAILDINLGGDSSLSVAEDLRNRGVPFLFASGYGEQAQLSPEFQGQEVISKPYGRSEIIEAMIRIRTKG